MKKAHNAPGRIQGKPDKWDSKSLSANFVDAAKFCDHLQDAGSIEFAQQAIPRGRTPTPEGDPRMSGALAYLYTMVHVVQGRLELHRLRTARIAAPPPSSTACWSV